METLTVATLEHLPTAALFVFDLTEECGCSVQQQWCIRTELLQRFPHKLWIDVISKADMLEKELGCAAQLGAQAVPGVDAAPADAVQAVRLPPCELTLHSRLPVMSLQCLAVCRCAGYHMRPLSRQSRSRASII